MPRIEIITLCWFMSFMIYYAERSDEITMSGDEIIESKKNMQLR